MSTTHTFQDSLRRSHSYSDEPWWEDCYRTYFGHRYAGLVDLRADGPHQRLGIDRQILLLGGNSVFVDEKVRDREYDDFCLEYSSHGGQLNGWMEKDLACDFIAYAFVQSRRCYFLPYDSLKFVWEANKRDWYAKYHNDKHQARNEHYVTKFLPVPIHVVLEACTDAQLVRWKQAA